MDVLKVSTKSNPNSVAGALAGVLRENGKAEIQAIGAGALNQAVKAVAIARGFVAPHGMDLVCVPAFIDITIDGEERTAIKLLVEPPLLLSFTYFLRPIIYIMLNCVHNQNKELASIPILFRHKVQDSFFLVTKKSRQSGSHPFFLFENKQTS